MNRATYFRFFAVSLAWSALFSVVSLFGLIKFSNQAVSEHRSNFLLSIGSMVERQPLDHALQNLPFPFGNRGGGPFANSRNGKPDENFQNHPDGFAHPPFPNHGGPEDRQIQKGMFPPPPPMNALGPGGPGPFGPGGPNEHGPGGPEDHGPGGPNDHGPVRPDMWIVDANQKVITSNSSEALPPEVVAVAFPDRVHQIKSTDHFFNVRTPTLILKLNSEPPAFLIFRENETPFRGPMFFTQLLSSFATVLAGVFFALVLTFIYLKHKSREAKSVLLQLEKGDLKARFQIRKFDEFGSLILDFNRMASEIERLVSRVHETELARKNLLQELGHDLRTPLTSISAAFDTLKKHYTKMSDSDRTELFDLVEVEVSYFKELLEKLMTIATLDEPHYKNSTDQINIYHLIEQEVKSRQSNKESPLRWTLEPVEESIDSLEILGDEHLILRLFKNALDNASRFAKSEIKIKVHLVDSQLKVEVNDDGPGLTKEEFASFGHRRMTRTRNRKSEIGFSIGLGSVIMTAIAQVHGGKLWIENRTNGADIIGASVKISLPRARHEF